MSLPLRDARGWEIVKREMQSSDRSSEQVENYDASCTAHLRVDVREGAVEGGFFLGGKAAVSGFGEVA